MINERRKSDKETLSKQGNLLSIMLLDPLFDNNDKTIIDESISFFIAGTLTQASTLSNTLAFLM